MIGPALAAEREKIQKDVLDQADRLNVREEELNKADIRLKKTRAELDAQVEKRLKAATEEIVKQEQAKAQEAAQQKLESARQQIEADRKKIHELEQTELTLRKERESLSEERRTLDLKIQRTLDEERQKIQARAMEESNKAFELKLAEANKQLQDTRKQLDEASRKAEQGSQQLQGEVQELSLEDTLQTTFPTDEFEPVGKGQQGGDVLQHVMAPGGRRCGSILWESKRTKNWSDQWLQKLRDDQRAAEADVAIILTAAMPKSIANFGQLDGVWVTNWNSAMSLTGVLRQMLIQVSSTRMAAEGKDHKMSAVYDYLTSRKFSARVESIVESIVSMQEDLAREKRAITTQWSKREANMRRIIEGAGGMHGDLQGIAGSALGDVPGLGFDDQGEIESKDGPPSLPDHDTSSGELQF